MLDITMLVAFSDYLILDAIRQLSVKYPLCPLPYAEIVKALPTPCSTKTVQRSIERLEKSGHIVRCGPGNKIGYLYEVLSPVEGAI